MIRLTEKLRGRRLFLAGAIYATPLWILLGLSLLGLRWLVWLELPGAVIMSLVGVFLALTIGSGSIDENIAPWQIPVASGVFYYFLILLILLIVRGRRDKPANQQSDPL